MSNSAGKRLYCLKDLIKTARCSKFSALKRLTKDDQGNKKEVFCFLMCIYISVK